MKRIIKNKVYDTDTATSIGFWYNEYPREDFNFISKELYRKKTGEYFLYMEGGAFTECAATSGNSTYGSWKIVPLSIEQARKFAFEFLDSDVALAEFEPASDDESKQCVSFMLPTSVMENIRLISRNSSRRISDVVAEARTEYIAKNAL